MLLSLDTSWSSATLEGKSPSSIFIDEICTYLAGRPRDRRGIVV